MYCSKCGNQVLDDSLFCSKCGNQVRNGAETKNHVANLFDEFESQSEYEESGFSVLQFIRGIPLGLVFVAFVLPLFVISCPKLDTVIGEYSTYQSLDLSTAMAKLLSQLPASEINDVKDALGNFSIAIFSVLAISALSFGFSFFQRILAAILGIVALVDFSVILVTLVGKSNEMISVHPGSGSLLSIGLFIVAIVLCFIPCKRERSLPLIVKIALVFVPVGIVFLCAFPGIDASNSFKDGRDGQKYKTVVVGNQTWMAENLNYESTGSICYGNTRSLCRKYGRLYTYNDAKNICPDGWRLPNDSDFESLLYATGGGDGYTLGSERDKSGFNLLMSGGRESSNDDSLGFKYVGLNKTAYLWTSSKLYDGSPLFWTFDEMEFARDLLGQKYDFYSVRCVK